MKEQDVYIKAVDWHVKVFHDVDSMCADEIIDSLIALGCKGENLRDAESVLWHNLYNKGLTFSNIDSRKTIMVIGKTKSGKEYWNTLDHEKNHLLQDISIKCRIDPYGEDISYISGELVRDVYDCAKEYLCDCCRKYKQVKLFSIGKKSVKTLS